MGEQPAPAGRIRDPEEEPNHIMKPNFEGFTTVDFPPPNGSLPGPPQGFVYVFFWIDDGVEVAFYVGETGRLAARINEYCMAGFGACTDFRTGEAIRYLIGVKKRRIILKYRPSKNQKEDEKQLIRDLLLSGVRILNSFPGYDYRYADKAEERQAVQNYCDMFVRLNNSDRGDS